MGSEMCCKAKNAHTRNWNGGMTSHTHKHMHAYIYVSLPTTCRPKGQTEEYANNKYKMWLIKLNINRVITKRWTNENYLKKNKIYVIEM